MTFLRVAFFVISTGVLLHVIGNPNIPKFVMVVTYLTAKWSSCRV